MKAFQKFKSPPKPAPTYHSPYWGRVTNTQLHTVEKWFYEDPEIEYDGEQFTEYEVELNAFTLCTVLYWTFGNLDYNPYKVITNSATNTLYVSKLDFEGEDIKTVDVYRIIGDYDSKYRSWRNYNNPPSNNTWIIGSFQGEDKTTRIFRENLYKFLTDAKFQSLVHNAVQQMHEDEEVAKAIRMEEYKKQREKEKAEEARLRAIEDAKRAEEELAAKAKAAAWIEEQAKINAEREAQAKLEKELLEPDRLIDKIASNSRKRKGFLSNLFKL